MQARPDDTGIVEYQHVTGNEQPGECAEREVGNRAAGDMQQTAGFGELNRPLPP